ncbi:MAG: ectoine/hydroxyectoine ABC transporter permease subunit EhuD [Myxococcales bacterium]|jgi:polar amino acid transport system permease protein
MEWDWALALKATPYLAEGLRVTLLATAGGMALALILGLVFALLRRSQARWIAWPATGLIELVRSTPLLIQLIFVYFLVPNYGWNTPLVTGILVLGVHYSAYTSEVYRAGIEGVGRGQWEAAVALNLPRSVLWRRIVLPQALPPVVPAMGNYLVAMFKDTPMLYAITVPEVLARATYFNSRYGSSVESYSIVGFTFLGLSLLAAALIHWAEQYLVIREE